MIIQVEKYIVTDDYTSGEIHCYLLIMLVEKYIVAGKCRIQKYIVEHWSWLINARPLHVQLGFNPS